MDFVDFILNLAGIMLWLNWRSAKFDPLVKTSAASLAGTLRRAEPSAFNRWHFFGSLVALLLIRAIFYRQIGAAVDWTPKLHLTTMAISFRSDFFGRMFSFSLLSFGLALAVFYIWLLLLSLVNQRAGDSDPLQRMVRLNLGRIDRWPAWLKALLPLLGAIILWLLLSPLLARSGLIPHPPSVLRQMEQGVLLGLSGYLSWKYLIGGLLFLHLLNSYVYFGNYPFWNFVNLTARNLLRPLDRLPLRVGRIDFAPLLGIAFVFVAANLAEAGLVRLYARFLI